MAITRVVFNQKGGVGKSTLSVNLAAESAKRGQRTLLIDLDAQGNSSYSVAFQGKEGKPTVADLFKQVAGWFTKPEPAVAFTHPTCVEGLSVLPADPSLATIERELESRYKMFKLREAIRELSEHFDRIYIDTPPNFNFYSKAALIAADRLLIPFDCDTFALQAIENLMQNVMELKSDHNPDLRIEGVIINQFHPQAKLPRELVEQLKIKGLPVLEPYVSRSVKIKESHARRLPLVKLDPKHATTQQIASIVEKIES